MRLFKNTRPGDGLLDEGYVTLAHKPKTAAEPLRIILRGRDNTYGLYLEHDDLRILINALVSPDFEAGTMRMTTLEKRRIKDLMAQWEGQLKPDDVAKSPEPQEATGDDDVIQRHNTFIWPDGNPVITNPDGEPKLVLTVPYAPPKTNPAIKLLEQNARAIDDLNENRERTLVEYDQALAALKQEQAMALSTLVHDEILIHYLAGDDSADANR